MKKIGKLDDRTIVCKTCDTIYEFDPADAQILAFNMYRVECPECGQGMILQLEGRMTKTNGPIIVEDANEKVD